MFVSAHTSFVFQQGKGTLAIGGITCCCAAHQTAAKSYGTPQDPHGPSYESKRRCTSSTLTGIDVTAHDERQVMFFTHDGWMIYFS